MNRRIAWALLAPTPLIFCIREAMHATSLNPASVPGLGIATGMAGGLSLLGVAATLWIERRDALVGALLVLGGHFGVSDFAADLGAAMVYLGTGVLAKDLRFAVPAAMTAALGALLRLEHAMSGHAVVAIGAGWLGVILARKALDR